MYTPPPCRATRTLSRLSCTLALAASLALAACGGSDGAPGATGQAAAAALVSTSTEPVGLNCASGGTRIDAGLDANASGVLDPAEITSTQYVCNGAIGSTGAVGPTALVRVAGETAGLHCAGGGSAINAGIDSNGNGLLDAGEVTSTSYVCTGTVGRDSLIVVAPESAGGHCTYGGTIATAGLDTNGNGLLENGEITSTSYTCNGAPGAAGPGVTWIDQATSTTAAANTGYLVDSALPLTVTLPASAPAGTLVSVSGLGSGRWTIAAAAGGSIVTKALHASYASLYGNWTQPVTGFFTALSTSSDGMKLFSISISNGSSNLVQHSLDGGVTWSALPNQPTPVGLQAVAESADGRVVIVAEVSGEISVSIDAGTTWTRSSLGGGHWEGVALSADGAVLAAAEQNGIWVSTDHGHTWAATNSANVWFNRVAVSADGSTLFSGDHSGVVYESIDGGSSWTTLPTGQTGIIDDIALSADGQRIVVVAGGDGAALSTDAGLSFHAIGASTATNVALSADGSVIALSDTGRVRVSLDDGQTFTTQFTNVAAFPYAGPLVMAGDASALAVLTGSGIELGLSGRTSVGGSLGGGQYDAVTLQSLGNDLWMPTSDDNYTNSFLVQ